MLAAGCPGPASRDGAVSSLAQPAGPQAALASDSSPHFGSAPELQPETPSNGPEARAFDHLDATAKSLDGVETSLTLSKTRLVGQPLPPCLPRRRDSGYNPSVPAGMSTGSLAGSGQVCGPIYCNDDTTLGSRCTLDSLSYSGTVSATTASGSGSGGGTGDG